MSDTYLKYTGGSFIFGVPARDLTEEEAKLHGVKRLLESGLYEKADKPFSLNVSFEHDGTATAKKRPYKKEVNDA